MSSLEPDLIIYSINSKEEIRIKTSSGVKNFLLNKNNDKLFFYDLNGDFFIHDINFSSDPSSISTLISKHFSIVSSKLLKQNFSKYIFSLYSLNNEEIIFLPSTNGNLLFLLPSSSSSLSYLENSIKESQTKSYDVSVTSSPSSSSLSSNWKEVRIKLKESDLSFSSDLFLASLSPNQCYLVTVNSENILFLYQINHKNIFNLKFIKKINLNKILNEQVIDLQWCIKDDENFLLIFSSKSMALLDSFIDLKKYFSPTELYDPDLEDMLLSVDVDEIDQKEENKEEKTEEKKEDFISDEELLSQIELPTSSQSLATNAETSTKKLKKKNQNKKDDEDDILFDSIHKIDTKFLDTSEKSADLPPVKSLFQEEANDIDDIEDDIEDNLMVDEEEDIEDDNLKLQSTSHPLTNSALIDSSTLLNNLINEAYTPQPPLQPTKTKLDEKQSQYLVWNSIGYIISKKNNFENRIDIRFTNTEYGKHDSFPDRIGFTMADLSYEGAVFASPPEEKSNFNTKYNNDDIINKFNEEKKFKGSTIYYHSLGQNKLDGINDTFKIVLNDGEAVEALACGCGFIAIATSHQFLRIFSTSGLEVSVSWLDGPVLSMVAYQSTLAIVYHSNLSVTLPIDTISLNKSKDNSYGSTSSYLNSLVSSSSTYNSSLLLNTFDINWKTGCSIKPICQKISVPLSPTPTFSSTSNSFTSTTSSSKSSLKWLGFDSDSSRVAIMDSAGMVSILTCSNSNWWHWLPVLDTKNNLIKNIEQKVWPITIKNNKLLYINLFGETSPKVSYTNEISTKNLIIPIVENINNNALNSANKKNYSNYILFDNDINYMEYNLKNKNFYHNYYYNSTYPMANSIGSYSSSSLTHTNMNSNHIIKNYNKNLIINHINYMKKIIENDKYYLNNILSIFNDSSASSLSLALQFLLKIRSIAVLKTTITVANQLGQTYLAQITEEIVNEKEYSLNKRLAETNFNIKKDLFFKLELNSNQEEIDLFDELDLETQEILINNYYENISKVSIGVSVNNEENNNEENENEFSSLGFKRKLNNADNNLENKKKNSFNDEFESEDQNENFLDMNEEDDLNFGSTKGTLSRKASTRSFNKPTSSSSSLPSSPPPSKTLNPFAITSSPSTSTPKKRASLEDSLSTPQRSSNKLLRSSTFSMNAIDNKINKNKNTFS